MFVEDARHAVVPGERGGVGSHLGGSDVCVFQQEHERRLCMHQLPLHVVHRLRFDLLNESFQFHQFLRIRRRRQRSPRNLVELITQSTE